jgi:hypothetical protein
LVFLTTAVASGEFILNGDFETADGRIGLTNTTALDSLSVGDSEWWDTYLGLPGGQGGDAWLVGGNGIQFEVQRRYQGRFNSMIELDGHGRVGEADPYFGHNGSIGQSVTIGSDGPPLQLAFDYRSRLAEFQMSFPSVNPVDTFAIGVYVDGVEVLVVNQPNAENWTRQSLLLNLAAGTYFIEFRGLGLADSFGGLLDNVSLTRIPEPEAYLLVGVGLIGFYFLRRRQRA